MIIIAVSRCIFELADKTGNEEELAKSQVLNIQKKYLTSSLDLHDDCQVRAKDEQARAQVTLDKRHGRKQEKSERGKPYQERSDSRANARRKKMRILTRSGRRFERVFHAAY
eukprot:3795793-Amphidinium_carterae.1